ncbi:MAG: hypothetical protein ACLP9Y_16895, partial [Mycobacterium sp.]
MGETNFTTGVYKGSDITTAYRQAIADYRPEQVFKSGTIGVEQAVGSPMTAMGADLYARRIGGGRKYGPALAIPVASDGEFEFKKVKFTVQLPIRQWRSSRMTTDIGVNVYLPDLLEHEVDSPPPYDSGWRSTNWFDLEAAATNKAFAQFGQKVHEIDVKPKLKTKKVVERAKGRSQTRYELRADYEGYGSGRLYETKSQAVAAAKELLELAGQPWGYFKGSDLVVNIRAVQYWPA